MLKQVYQKLIFPKILTKQEYFEPYSAQNTSGDISKAYALFQLIDPVTIFNTKYSPSSASFSQSYKYLLNRINTNGKAEKILAEALEKIRTREFVALGPSTQEFYLIETAPYNLFETDGTNISFTVGPPDSDADFVEIKSNEKRQISFYGFSAHIIRPWFSPKIFGVQPWTINGCSAGAYSDGTYTNQGVLPLIPVELLISINEQGERHLQAIISDLAPLTPVLDSRLQGIDSKSWCFAKAANDDANNPNIPNKLSSPILKNGVGAILVDEFGNHQI